MVEGILHMRSRIMRSSRGDTEVCCGNPGARRRWDSGWATQQTPAGLPVTSHFSLPMVDKHGPSPQHHTCRQECLQQGGRKETKLSVIKVPSLIFSQSRFVFVCTGAVLVCLKLSDGGASTHRDQLGPELLWLLKHQEDPQGFEWTAARMPY